MLHRKERDRLVSTWKALGRVFGRDARVDLDRPNADFRSQFITQDTNDATVQESFNKVQARISALLDLSH
jgi:hypothetical protein